MILIVSIFFLGCTKENDENNTRDNFTGKYGGKPLNGSVTQVLTGEGFEDINWNGEGMISLIEASDDSISIVFLADFGSQREVNFKMRGKVDGFNFRSGDDEPASFFRIVDEKITGNSESAVQEMRFDGTMKKGQAKMTAQIYFKETNHPFPKGATLSLKFNTSREITNSDGGDVSGCQMRLVPIWSPTGVTMGMVPDC
ncbi:MAG: hypothetical protein ACRDE7_02340 [Sphingobacterium sp.]